MFSDCYSTTSQREFGQGVRLKLMAQAAITAYALRHDRGLLILQYGLYRIENTFFTKSTLAKTFTNYFGLYNTKYLLMDTRWG
jgi:hypothetical protein